MALAHEDRCTSSYALHPNSEPGAALVLLSAATNR
jgi:hypothetical protein